LSSGRSSFPNFSIRPLSSQSSAGVTKANSIITQLTSQVKELEVKSSIDSLTKVYNRGALISYLSKMCAREDVKYDSHLLILDIDDFKQINDRYGHIAGDKILIFIASLSEAEDHLGI
jgi:GGDEF domain-containing protein